MVGVIIIILVSIAVATLLGFEIVGLVRDIKKRKKQKQSQSKSSETTNDKN